MTSKTLLDLENAILDLFEKNRITIDIGETACWQILAALYEDELIEEPHRRETIIENIERQKEQLLVNILGPR
jgi:DNA-binding TFAR19-related protein (PDSD5 family)